MAAVATTATSIKCPSVLSCLKQFNAASTATDPNSIPTPELLYSAIEEIMTGVASEAQIGSFLTAFNPKYFTSANITACASAMKFHSISVNTNQQPLLDIVGTGGDGSDTYNVSTTSAFILAAAGLSVVKHGNRSSSSKCGSADLLESAGACITLNPQQAIEVLESSKFTFLFAPQFHPAMRYVSSARKQLSFRTIFNVLGPLTNPCKSIKYQVTGVYSLSLGQLFIEAFKQQGLEAALVMHSQDGMDEISPATSTNIWQLINNQIIQSTITPEDFGLPYHSLSEISSGTPIENVAILLSILQGKPSAYLDYILMNSSAGLVTAGLAKNWKDGVTIAREQINSGAALNVFNNYIQATQKYQLTTATAVNQSPSQSILHRIAAHRRTVIESAKLNTNQYSLLLTAFKLGLPSIINPLDRCRNNNITNGLSLAAEIKRASPSLGIIAANINVIEQALIYANAGAAIISVLTEPKWFHGSITDLQQIRLAVDSLPNRPCILLKDFVLDEYQLIEARVSGADTALLIVALLPLNELIHLIQFARSIQMEPLVEVANAIELTIALQAGALFIGVNNRDLHTFNVDTNTTNRIAEQLKQEHNTDKQQKSSTPILLAALSGIKSRSDVLQYQSAGCELVLVGETLMRSADPAGTIRELLGSNQTNNNSITMESSSNNNSISHPLVKICGIRDIAAATVARDSGVDLIGLIFANSKRRVTVDQATAIVRAMKSIPNQSQSLSPLTSVTATNSSYYHHQANQLSYKVNKFKSAGRPLIVGVFADSTADEINSIANVTGIDLIQLHGKEGFQFASQLCKPVIRSIPVIPGETTASGIIELLEQNPVDNIVAILLDTKPSNNNESAAAAGGSGLVFDWSIASTVSTHYPIIIAGGLNPDNIQTAITVSNCYCVDVSSGCESATIIGQKDYNKMRLFVARAKSTNNNNTV